MEVDLLIRLAVWRAKVEIISSGKRDRAWQ
jgi:hypothetical protein